MGAPEFDEVLAPNSGGIGPNLSTRSTRGNVITN